MKIVQVISIILIGLILTSCSSVKKIETVKTEVKRAPLNLDRPEPIVMDELNWIIIN